MFAYFGEFCPLDGRGKKLGFLLMFWVLGGIYVSGLAWLIIPQTGLDFHRKSLDFYHPPTKLREGNVFTGVSVQVSAVPDPFQEVGISGATSLGE